MVVLPRHCYLGLSAAVDERAARYGWTLRRVDIADTEAVLAAADGADLVWLESPTNPMMETADLPRLGAELPAGVTFVVDNTFATPLLQQPLSTGADIVVHSATKIISGHSDVLLGAVVTRDDARCRALQPFPPQLRRDPGPMEAYLALRGLRTLPLRLAQAQASAQVLAERLAEHPRVRGVRYPGLPTDPGHAAGAGHHVRVRLAALRRVRRRRHCRCGGRGVPAVGLRHQPRRRGVDAWSGAAGGPRAPSVPEGLVRMSVGIEHVEDLWADLAQALESAARGSVALGLGRAGHQRGDHLRRRSARRRSPRPRARTIGISTPCCAASSWIDAQDLTPSATCRVEAVISATVRPWPSSSPKVRFRDSGDEQVATRSPRPASPEKVYGSAPRAAPSRLVSASPRVITDAVALAPRPSPMAIPTARAITFLVAPAELAAHHVGVGVGPEARGVAHRLQRLRGGQGRRWPPRWPTAGVRRSPGPGSGR